MTTAVAAMAQDERAEPEDEQYPRLLESLRVRFAFATAGGVRLFTTDASGLFDAFLGALPADRRQHYRCNACRRFVDRFGGLVTIAPDGAIISVMWDMTSAPPFFRAAVQAVAKRVARAQVNGVFISEERAWGLPSNRSQKPPFQWNHMAVMPSNDLVFKATPLRTASQAAAEKLQDYGTLGRGLEESPIDVVRQAHTLLTTGNLSRSEKCIGVAKWLLDLHEAREATKNVRVQANLTWLAVATAPAGFCHVRSTMIGTLLEDIAAGLPFETIKRRFDEKMHPLQYQRPQAAPSAGNIAQAEKVVQALASSGALSRRFARLEDIKALWLPKTAKQEEASSGVFGHLKAKGAKSAAKVEQPPVTMTWEKFARTVLPEAEKIEFYVPARAAAYSAFVTATNQDAPPILQWDQEGQRNPVSWYFYNGGSIPQNWNLTPHAFQRVTAITLQPSMWYAPERFGHQGEKVFFLLDGARDLRYTSGSGFFPEILRSEYHGVRATMEAYARTAVVVGASDATACGVGLQKGSPWGYRFMVTSKGQRITCELDRWD